MVAVASQQLLQLSVVLEVVTIRGVGCVMVTNADKVQPFASVTIKVYVPAQSPVAVTEVCPEGNHK